MPDVSRKRWRRPRPQGRRSPRRRVPAARHGRGTAGPRHGEGGDEGQHARDEDDVPGGDRTEAGHGQDLAVRGEYCSALPFTFVRDDVASGLLDAAGFSPALCRQLVAVTHTGRRPSAAVDAVVDVARARLAELADVRRSAGGHGAQRLDLNVPAIPRII